MGVKRSQIPQLPQVASQEERTAVKAINEKSTIVCERQSQAPHMLLASDDVTAPQQGTKGLMFTVMAMTHQEKLKDSPVYSVY